MLGFGNEEGLVAGSDFRFDRFRLLFPRPF